MSLATCTLELNSLASAASNVFACCEGPDLARVPMSFHKYTGHVMCQPSTKELEILVELFIIRPCRHLVQTVSINFVVWS